MTILRCICYTLFFASISACADQTNEGEKDIDMVEFKWKNRLILSYPKNESAWVEQQKLMEKLAEEINDRDLIILRLDKGQNEKNSKPSLSENQSLALIKKYKIEPGSHILIGKDGGEKRRQIGELKLLPLFQLIDKMPMRRAEMKSKKAE